MVKVTQKPTYQHISHLSGPTCLAFHPGGTYLFTGGADSLVSRLSMDDSTTQVPVEISEIEKPITSITMHPKGDYWIVSSLDDKSQKFLRDTGIQLDIAATARNGASIRSVALDSTGEWLAVASDEFNIQLVKTTDFNKTHAFLQGHTNSPHKVTWHPKRSLLTSSGTDGKLIVWDINEPQPSMLKSLEGIIPPNRKDAFTQDCSAIWHPSGDYFAVISNNEIVTISASTWQRSGKFADASVSMSPTALAFSSDGQHLVSGHTTKVCLWSTETRSIVAVCTAEDGDKPIKTGSALAEEMAIRQLAFSPTRNLVAWTDGRGRLSRWHDAIPSEMSSSKRPASPSNSGPSSLFDLEPLEQADDILEQDEDHEGSNTDNFGNDFRIDAIEDDDDDGQSEQGKRDSKIKEMVSITKAQLPFQPSSTPMNKKKRYLAFNVLGTIEVTEHEDHNTVEVHFHDQSIRRSWHFQDLFKFDKGYLGERGALFACPAQDTEHPAQVHYKPYGSWSRSMEWVYELRPEGRVLGIAAGGVSPNSSLRDQDDPDLEGYGNIVIATNEDDLTFLSGAGHERRIIGLGADFVSMVASDEWVFVVHRAGSTTIDGSQNLSYSLINFEDFTVRQRDILPIGKGQTLKWIGITDEGAPAIYDSRGYLHVLTKFRIAHHASWARVLDTTTVERQQGKDESYWPTGVSQNKLLAVILKGREQYPGFPRPYAQDIPLQLPFRRKDSKDEPYERQLLLLEFERDALGEELTNQTIMQRERDLDKEFLKLMQVSLKANDTGRAIELAKLFHNTASFDAAVKVADFYQLSGFKAHLEALKEAREGQDRLWEARERRQQWTRTQAAPRRFLDDSQPYTVNTFQGLDRAERFHRPGLSRATPVVEKTQYTAPPDSDTSFEEDFSTPAASFNAEAKRKRVEVEDDSQSLDLSSSMPPPPPPKKLNPFGKKAQDGNRNPFGRKADANKTIQKSDSFFDKVDKAELDNSKSKRATKAKSDKKANGNKDGSRQTTLFGMLPKKGKEHDDDVPTQSTDIDMMDSSSLAPSQPTDFEDTQATDDETQDTHALET